MMQTRKKKLAQPKELEVRVPWLDTAVVFRALVVLDNLVEDAVPRVFAPVWRSVIYHVSRGFVGRGDGDRVIIPVCVAKTAEKAIAKKIA
jgi:hypothetical protein